MSKRKLLKLAAESAAVKAFLKWLTSGKSARRKVESARRKAEAVAKVQVKTPASKALPLARKKPPVSKPVASDTERKKSIVDQLSTKSSTAASDAERKKNIIDQLSTKTMTDEERKKKILDMLMGDD